MDAVKDHPSAVPFGDVYGRGEVRSQRPRPLLDMFVRPRTHLVRCEYEHLAILSPERKVEQPDEVQNCHLFEGKV